MGFNFIKVFFVFSFESKYLLLLELDKPGFGRLNYFSIEEACLKANLEIKKGDTVLLYTNHYRNYYGTEHWKYGLGVTAEATRWLGNKGICSIWSQNHVTRCS